MKRVSREQIKKSMQEKIARREPIILAGAGCGLVARAEEAAGADLIMAYNTGVYRMDGHVSLVGYRYYSDGNKDTLELAAQLCDTVKKTPVAAGIVAIFSLTHLQRRGQLFLSILWVFITCLTTSRLLFSSFISLKMKLSAVVADFFEPLPPFNTLYLFSQLQNPSYPPPVISESLI